MNLNRNNYEEFLLLYTDGELTPEQMAAVDNFLQDNVDLQAELNMLLEAKLVLEDDIILDKNFLYKSETDAINTSNAQEKFLLYIDNELNKEGKANVENFVLQNPIHQNNFTTLKNTVLPLEKMECPNKEDLYKEERRPVFFMWMRRLSVAAIFLLMALGVWMFTSKHNDITKVDGTKQSTNTAKNNTNTVVTNTTTNPLKSTVVPRESKQQKIITTQPVVARNTTVNSQPAVVPVPNKKIQQPITAVTLQQETVATTEKHNAKQPDVTTVAVKNNNEIAPAADNTIANNVAKNNVQQTVYKYLDTDEDEDMVIKKQQAVYIGNVQVEKKKLNNLFKKAKGLLVKEKLTTEEPPTTVTL
jgi:hypothetical protein